MKFIGIDIGSSSIKISLLDGEKGNEIFGVSLPENEMEIIAAQFSWAEQKPETWWDYIKQGLKSISDKNNGLKEVGAIGITYQMHGLVLVDEELNTLRPAIIWCDSRAAEIGNEAYNQIGEEKCFETILGSPGNFTASKLKWVKENEPEIYNKTKYFLLPGDYIAAKLTGKAQTTPSGLSEAALWNFAENRLATEILEGMGLEEKLVPEIVPNFGPQAVLQTKKQEFGFNHDCVVSYRAGDQPNNAFSLNVLNPGEIATTAGTSAVVYAVSDKNLADKDNRINTFLHVNNTESKKRNGVMLCINGSGILYSWLRKLVSLDSAELISYDTLNRKAAEVKPGSDDLRFYPFGNGVERIFKNKPANSGLENLNFNIHRPSHIIRAACEGIVFAMNYGFEIMNEIGLSGKIIRAGRANLFLSPVFREIFCNVTQTTLELYNTSGAEGAARGAALGVGFYKTNEQAFQNLKCLERIEPQKELSKKYQKIYQNWKNHIKIEK